MARRRAAVLINSGTFFKITTAGKKTGLYDFGAPIGSGYDGAYPYGRLIYVHANDMFYGTTIAGGSGSCSGGGCGIAFSVSPSGKETILQLQRGQRWQPPHGKLALREREAL